MLRSYLGGALRQIGSSRFYSTIAIGGLAVGLACSILILLYVRDELGHDRWLPDADRVYRFHYEVRMPGREPVVAALTPGPLAAAVAEEAPEVEAATRMVLADIAVVRDTRPVKQTLALVDPHFLDVLRLPLRAGTAALDDPSNVLLTERTARAVLGDGDPIGQTITVCCFDDEQREYRVAGILRDLPASTHLDFGMVAPFDPQRYRALAQQADSWLDVSGYTYVRLAPGASAGAVLGRMPAMLARRIPPIDVGGQLQSVADMVTLRLMGVRDLYLHSAGIEGDRRPVGDLRVVQALALVAALILLIAATNFVNLATARSTRRAREIGVRKIIGASRRDIVLQYLCESMVASMIALVLALALIELALPMFNAFVGRRLSPPYQPGLLATLVAGAIGVGVLAGLYPALVLSRFGAADVKSSGPAAGTRGGRVRAALVLLQFAIATALALCTTIVYQQTRFATDQDPGFESANRFVVENLRDPSVRPASDGLAERVANLPGVVAAARSDAAPGDPVFGNLFVEVPGRAGGPELTGAMSVDYGFFETLGVRPRAGRTLARDHAGDDFAGATAAHGEAGIVINDAAVRHFGYASAEAAVDQTLTLHAGPDEVVTARIVGVVPDLHFVSARHRVEPTVFYRDPRSFDRLTIHLAPGAPAATVRAIEATWGSLLPAVPFVGETADARLAELRRDDRRWSGLLAAFALLAVLVACSGLYGLASFVTETRRKEIAIRRVMGGSIRDITWLLVSRLSRPVVLGSVVALPISYLYLQRWLRQFAYRIELSPVVFVAVAATAVAVAALTIGLQAMWVARRAPVASLRTE